MDVWLNSASPQVRVMRLVDGDFQDKDNKGYFKKLGFLCNS